MHAGAGVKAKVGEKAAFRAEYRFTHMSGHNDGGGLASEAFYNQLNSHRLFVGLSVFLR